jgi:predicted nucleotidyltransferase component of viral defense system
MAPRLTEAQVVEHFHLTFLQVLQTRLDQTQYVVKGGVNLRYFFDSQRYSEDVDLDAIAIEPWVLEEKVDKVLRSPTTRVLLRAGGSEVGEFTKPKQTDTTQRWKVLIKARDRRDPVRTKIEFSHRTSDPRRQLEAVPDRVVAPYAVRAPTLFHYLADAATEQKVLALALRSETQARDVFDLELLLHTHREIIRDELADESTRELAADRALELPFEAFQDQVLPFLDPEVVELYEDRATWTRMQTFVADWLSGSSS